MSDFANSNQATNYHPFNHTHIVRKSYCKYNQINTAVSTDIVIKAEPENTCDSEDTQDTFNTLDNNSIPIDVIPRKAFWHGRGYGHGPWGYGHGPHGHGPHGHGPHGHGPPGDGHHGHGPHGHSPPGHGPPGHGHYGYGPPGHGPHGHGRGHMNFKHCQRKIRTSINLRKKIEIIRYAEMHPGKRQAEIADMFGIDRSAVTKILKKKSEFLDFSYGHESSNLCMNEMTTIRRNNNPYRQPVRALEVALNNWYCETVYQNAAIRISDQLVKEQALQLAKKFGATNFSASDVWLDKFYRRFHLFRESNLHQFQESEDMASFDDDEWRPPTAAQEKIMKAKRDRSNKISELMGQKMLLGWKMLASSCDNCDTVMLQDREGIKFCVSCHELDSDSQKDDPAVNMTAAESQLREHQESPIEIFPSTCITTLCTNNTDTTSQGHTIPHNTTEDTSDPNVGICTDTWGGIDTDDTLDVLVYKLKWATDTLRTSDSVNSSIELCNLIKSTADAVVAVKCINLPR